MEGFLIAAEAVAAELITRSLAIIPAAGNRIMGEGHVTSLLILSQVV